MVRQLTTAGDDLALMTKLLSDWLTESRTDGSIVEVDQLVAAAYGVSNETLLMRVRTTSPGGEVVTGRQVLRLKPSTRGVLEPYDIARQYRVMKGLRGTPVLVPEMGVLDEEGQVLGRPCFTMDYLEGETLQPPNYVLEADDAAKRRMSVSAVTMMADLHRVDWENQGLRFLEDEGEWIDAELGRWRRRHADLQQSWPALDALLAWLESHRPTGGERVLLHGDVKLSNFMWRGEEIVALLDWEMAGVGDPLMDLAYFLAMPTVNPDGAYLFAEGLSREETISLYEELTGFSTENLRWFEVLNFYKLAVILAICLDMFAQGETDDLQYFAAGSSAGRMISLGADVAGIDVTSLLDVPMPTPLRLVAATAASLEHAVLPHLEGVAGKTQVKAAVRALTVAMDGWGAS